jgi:transposase-like protein
MKHALTRDQNRHRIAVGWAVVSEGGNTQDYATRLGISRARVHQWLNAHQQTDLYDALKSGRDRRTLPDDRAARRSALIAEAVLGRRTMASVARIEGVSPAAISFWKDRNWIAVDDIVNELTHRRAA